jgi:hypothetical protein
MVLRTLRRRLSGLVLAGLALPALSLFHEDRQPVNRVEAGDFLAWMGEVVSGFWEETGMMINPDGNPRPSSTPESDTGMMIDPNG